MDGDDPDGQTLLFLYPTHFGGGQARYVRPIVKIEFGARSDPWPAHERSVHPVIAEVFPQLFTRPEIIVHALAPERTFWEKAMLLHEETYRPADKQGRPRMPTALMTISMSLKRAVQTVFSVSLLMSAWKQTRRGGEWLTPRWRVVHTKCCPSVSRVACKCLPMKPVAPANKMRVRFLHA